MDEGVRKFDDGCHTWIRENPDSWRDVQVPRLGELHAIHSFRITLVAAATMQRLGLRPRRFCSAFNQEFCLVAGPFSIARSSRHVESEVSDHAQRELIPPVLGVAVVYAISEAIAVTAASCLLLFIKRR